MSNKLPPSPVGVPPGNSYWNDWYEKLRTLVNSTLTKFTNLDFTGSNLTSLTTRHHNDLQNFDGGTATQYYHLTSAEHTEATATRSSRGVSTTDDVIIDLATKGLVLKDTQATPHYWRITISNVGALVISDLGTTKP